MKMGTRQLWPQFSLEPYKKQPLHLLAILGATCLCLLSSPWTPLLTTERTQALLKKLFYPREAWRTSGSGTKGKMPWWRHPLLMGGN